MTAPRAAQRHGFEKAVAGADAVLGRPGRRPSWSSPPRTTRTPTLTVRALRRGQPRVVREAAGADRGRAGRGAGRVARSPGGVLDGRVQPALVTRGAGGAGRRWPGCAAAKLVVYRVAAGPVPDGHWYHDRRQGGRLLGEVCHFVDTAQALVGAPIEDVTALSGGGPAGPPADDAVVALRFADGSLATIGYGSAVPRRGQGVDRGHAGAQPGGHRRLPVASPLDGRTAVEGPPGQGAPGQAAAFRQAVTGGATAADRGDAGHDAGHHPGRQQRPAAAVADAAPRRPPEQVQQLFDAKAAPGRASTRPAAPWPAGWPSFRGPQRPCPPPAATSWTSAAAPASWPGRWPARACGSPAATSPGRCWRRPRPR